MIELLHTATLVHDDIIESFHSLDHDGSGDISMRDLIQEVNRQPVRSIAGFGTAIRESGSRPALILIKRRNNVLYLTLRAAS